MIKLRVLIDTNVLLSGLIWNGNESRLLEMSISGNIHLLIPEFVIKEARRVLENKFPKHLHLLDDVITLLDCDILSEPSKSAIESALLVLRDSDDAEILASIAESKPDYAVTGDKDLLTDDIRAAFPVCRSVDFLREIDGRK